jgi:hypothetical protein
MGALLSATYPSLPTNLHLGVAHINLTIEMKRPCMPRPVLNPRHNAALMRRDQRLLSPFSPQRTRMFDRRELACLAQDRGVLPWRVISAFGIVRGNPEMMFLRCHFLNPEFWFFRLLMPMLTRRNRCRRGEACGNGSIARKIWWFICLAFSRRMINPHCARLP